MSTLELSCLLCPECRGLGWTNGQGWQTCQVCKGSGWQNSERAIVWLVAQLKQWRAERGRQRASEHD